MKIKAPLHSMDARGRFGLGIVFTAWRGLSVARRFVMPTNPNTGRQSVIRGILTTASRAWEGLTAVNRSSWEEYANNQNRKNVFGQDVRASGFNEFCALFVLATEVGETPVVAAPVVSAPLAVVDGVIEEGATDGLIDISWTADQGGFVDCGITALLPAGRKAKESDYRHNSYTADATAALALDGLVPGGKYGVRIRQVAVTGQVGPWMTLEVLAGTT